MGLRARQRAHTIEVILAAAAEVFGQRGYHGTSMEEVAQVTGCATATLYGYFPSKEALFSRLLVNLVGAYLEGVREAVASTATFADGVTAYFDHFLDFAERRQDFLRVMLSVMRQATAGTQPGAEQADALRDAYVALLLPLFDRAVDEGLLPAGLEHDLLVALLSGTLHSASLRWLLGESSDLVPAVHAARALFLAGLPAAAATLAGAPPR